MTHIHQHIIINNALALIVLISFDCVIISKHALAPAEYSPLFQLS